MKIYVDCTPGLLGLKSVSRLLDVVLSSFHTTISPRRPSQFEIGIMIGGHGETLLAHFTSSHDRSTPKGIRSDTQLDPRSIQVL